MKLRHLLGGTLLCLGLSAAHAVCDPPYTDVNTCLGGARVAVNDIKNIGYYISPVVAGTSFRAEYATEIGYSNNVVVVMYDVANPNAIDPLLPKLNSNLKLSLIVNSMFFDSIATARDDATVTNYINALATKLGPYMSYIHSLAVDEAVWAKQWYAVCQPAGTSPGQCLINGPSTTVVAQVIPSLERWSAMLRNKFPNTSYAYNEAGPMTRTGNFFLPKNWDLYGFDCYGGWDSCLNTGVGMQTLFNDLKTKVQALNSSGGYRRMVVIGETTAAFDRLRTRTANPPPGSLVGDVIIPNNAALGDYASTDDANLWGIAQSWKGLAASDPMVNTFIGFAWNTVWEGDMVWLGLRGYPYTRGQMEQWGRTVTNKTIVSPTTPPVIDFGATVGMWPHNGGPIWSWSTDNASSCRSVTEPTTYPSLPANGAVWFPPETAQRSITYTIECSNSYGATQRTINYTVGYPRNTTVIPWACRLNPSACI